MRVPFFRAELEEAEIAEVVDALRSGWLTSGPRVRRFEREFAAAVRAAEAVAVNSCTAALHLAVEALGLRAGDAVLVPTLTFAATAEVVRYQGAIPLLVDCDPVTGHLDLDDAERRIEAYRSSSNGPVVGIIPVHIGGLMMDVGGVRRFASAHGLWVVEDAAHAFPAAWRTDSDADWQECGEATADITCFSFYANKTITTGEGGMAVTDDPQLAARMRLMSLHGLSRDAWTRRTDERRGGRSWDYEILVPGFKYNLTDPAAALGIQQLMRAERLRAARERIAGRYREAFAGIDEIELPPELPNRKHAWHLFALRLRLDRLTVDRHRFLDLLNEAGVECSIHWRPLHLHPYYRETMGCLPEHFPVATSLWERLASLPLFPAMRDEEIEHVIAQVKRLTAKCAKP